MQTIDIQTVRRMQAQGTPIIDVLPAEDHAKHHIPQTNNVPYDAPDLPERVEELAGSKDAAVVVYCASPACDASPRAAERLEQAGFREVYDFEGGIQAWNEAGESLAGTDARE